jgi:hypothetical protein
VREPLEETGNACVSPAGDQIAVLMGVGPRGRDRIGEADEGEPYGGEHEVGNVREAKRGETDMRKTSLNISDDLDAVGVEI